MKKIVLRGGILVVVVSLVWVAVDMYGLHKRETVPVASHRILHLASASPAFPSPPAQLMATKSAQKTNADLQAEYKVTSKKTDAQQANRRRDAHL